MIATIAQNTLRQPSRGASPPDQIDAAHARQPTNLKRDYLHLRAQRTAA